MQTIDWQCERTFGQDQIKPGEKRTLLVLVLTAVTMIVEITAGVWFGSMALLADGLHMGSHAVAMAVAVFAYHYARRHAGDQRFSFGTGKVNSLAAFASAVILAAFAIIMIGESSTRLVNPVTINFNSALVVAFLGLVVNGASMLLLDHKHDHDDKHQHGDHDHGHKHDHNLRSAYLHVLADALTSLFAIVALLAGKYFGANWLDSIMGIVGAILIIRWSAGLLRESSQILLDKQLPDSLVTRLRDAIESSENDRISDLHIWRIGPGINAAEFVIHSTAPKNPDGYRDCIPRDLQIVHAAIEIHVEKI